jgi:hypothetical protein
MDAINDALGAAGTADEESIFAIIIYTVKVVCIACMLVGCACLLIEINTSTYVVAFAAAIYMLTYLTGMASATYRCVRPRRALAAAPAPPARQVAILPYREHIVVIVNPIQPPSRNANEYFTRCDARVFRFAAVIGHNFIFWICVYGSYGRFDVCDDI